MTVETISSRRMRALEMNAEYFGISALQLMESAGRAVAEEIGSRTEGERCLVVCGCGRNGGDGFVAARHLASLGFDVVVTLVGSEEAIRDPSTRRNWEALRRIAEIPKAVVRDSSLLSMPRDVDVIVDALLGIGIKGDVRPPLLQAIRAINEMDGFKVAVDIPSGINPDTGEVMGEAVRADLTVTFHRPKTGLPNAKEYTGEVVVKGIGLPPPIERYVGPGDVYLVTKERVPESHKGDFGRLLIVGGSETYSGAPALAALAALRTGVDLTFIAAPERTAYEIASLAPDLITIKLRGDSLNPRNVPVIRSWLGRVDAVVMGPGLGLRKETTQAVTDILSEIEGRDLPVLLDADGLKAFAELKRTFNISKLVLTPHAGELMLLTGRKAPKELSERASQVRDKAKEVKATILLKGPVDVISDGLEVKYNFTGNPGMTVGGTGDTLSGIIGAFLAQGFGA
ncbi:TPA: NAD(P)H-hydrate dehydratase, partial [Candidatus Bathyarchaeota archaeon]|nr:NAD(P)H-hydrate dehydratase [Candidatus Bathyarchaeota archaeon]